MLGFEGFRARNPRRSAGRRVADRCSAVQCDGWNRRIGNWGLQINGSHHLSSHATNNRSTFAAASSWIEGNTCE
jgi:hypothetical protein